MYNLRETKYVRLCESLIEKDYVLTVYIQSFSMVSSRALKGEWRGDWISLYMFFAETQKKRCLRQECIVHLN